MRRPLLLAALLLLWTGLAAAQVAPQPAAPAEAGRRVALVVGIGAYEHAGRLHATVGDARLMARTLRRLGFTLVTGGPVIEVDKRGFDVALQEFGRIAQGADIALFYFSGHGFQHEGSNWLVARDGDPAGLGPAHVDLGLVLRQLEAAQTRLSVVVLEASRNDPFRSPEATGAGLAAMRAPRGTIVAYATQPGRTTPDAGPGRNSTFTAALVEAMRRPGLGLMQVFNQASLRTIELSGGHQEPWLALSPLRGDFLFAPRDETSPASPAPAAAPSPDFTLVNFSGRPVRELRATLAGEAPWGEDRLGGNLLQAGERFRLTFPREQGCEVDVRADFGQGAEASEIRHLDTCMVDMLVLTPQGRLIPANPDVRLVNETGHDIRRLEAALASDGEWGPDRLEGGPMGPGGALELRLPQGLTCDVDIRAQFMDGTVREWRRQDTCAVAQYALR